MDNNDFKIGKFNEKSLNDLSLVLEEKDIKKFWHESMKNITIGFMFTVLTFNFLWLHYILPTLAAILLYIGFRDLRKENKDLNTAWIFSIINMIINVLNLIYISTPLNVNSKNAFIRAFILTVFQITFLIIFRKGIHKVFHKAGLQPKKDPVLRLIIWKVIVIISALTCLGQIWFISIPIIIYYFYIFRSLYKLSYDIENINCMTSDKNIRLNKRNLIFLYMISCIFIVGVSCVLSNHIRLDSVEVAHVKEFGTRNMLIDKGVPVKIVKDILDEDITMLKNVVNIQIFSDNLDFNSNSENNLKVTSIFIELKYDEMYAIEYFDWGGEGPYWQDGIAISNSRPLELINGRLLYESEGENYSSAIPRLSGGIVESTDIFGQERHDDKITGAINYPHNSKDQRGYIFYKINIQQGDIAGINIADYMHYKHPFRIPYTEIEKQNLMFSDNLRQNAKNFMTKSGMELNN